MDEYKELLERLMDHFRYDGQRHTIEIETTDGEITELLVAPDLDALISEIADALAAD